MVKQERMAISLMRVLFKFIMTILCFTEKDRSTTQCIIGISRLDFQVNPNIKFEVFIHKVDGLTDDHKIGKCLCIV